MAKAIKSNLSAATICSLLEQIAVETKREGHAYSDQHTLISSLFSPAREYSVGTIYLRLVVIDSLYSTNAGYSYFSFEEMAAAIWNLGKTEKEARDYFYAIVKDKKDKHNLFSTEYGIQKNLTNGSRQMSLLSKYCYYSLLQYTQTYPLGFPIYDRLAKLIAPRAYKQLTGKTLHLGSDISIKDYIEALDKLRQEIFGKTDALFSDRQQYDILDAYLWRMGKYDDGNLSLLLTRQEYEKFIKSIHLDASSKDQKDSDYKAEMCKRYGLTDEKEFDFNDKVLDCFKTNKNVFTKVCTDKARKDYLNAMLEHWKEYLQK